MKRYSFCEIDLRSEDAYITETVGTTIRKCLQEHRRCEIIHPTEFEEKIDLDLDFFFNNLGNVDLGAAENEFVVLEEVIQHCRKSDQE